MTVLSNNKKFLEELERIITSSRLYRCVRAVLVTTRDREHAINLVKESSLENKQELYHFTTVCRRRYRPECQSFEISGGECQDPAEVLKRINDIKSGGIVIIEDLLVCLKDQTGDRNARAQLNLMLSSETKIEKGIVMVFIEPPESECSLPNILSDQYSRIDVPIPRTDELEIIAREELAVAFHKADQSVHTEIIRSRSKKFADGLVGLTHTGARNALRDVLSKDPTDFDSAEKKLILRKASKLSRDLSMNILDSVDGELPIGLDNLYEYIEMNRERIGVARPDRVKGIFLLGPAGTGKTMLARSIGRKLELPVIEFRISSLINSYLGETEGRFEQAFGVFDAMAPVVIFIDEIEKAFGDQGGEQNGGTMMRCTGRLLSWLSDSPYPNFIVATANNVERMGEIGMTMTRRGRFDRAFFIDVPSRKARMEMLKNWLNPYMENIDQVLEKLSDKALHFSGADLKGVVDDAVNRASYSNEPLSLKHLEYEIEKNRLRVEALYDQFRKLRDFARLFAEPASMEKE